MAAKLSHSVAKNTLLDFLLVCNSDLTSPFALNNVINKFNCNIDL